MLRAAVIFSSIVLLSGCIGTYPEIRNENKRVVAQQEEMVNNGRQVTVNGKQFLVARAPVRGTSPLRSGFTWALVKHVGGPQAYTAPEIREAAIKGTGCKLGSGMSVRAPGVKYMDISWMAQDQDFPRTGFEVDMVCR